MQSACVCLAFYQAILMTLLLNQQNSVQSEEDERWRVREKERGGDGGERKDEQKDEKVRKG